MVTLAAHAPPLSHLRGTRRQRQVDPSAARLRMAGAARRSPSGHPRAGRDAAGRRPARRLPRPALGSGRRRRRAAARLRQPAPAPPGGDRAGAPGRPARPLRPLHRLDASLSGIRPRGAARRHRPGGPPGHRGAAARSYAALRPAGGGRPGPRPLPRPPGPRRGRPARRRGRRLLRPGTPGVPGDGGAGPALRGARLRGPGRRYGGADVFHPRTPLRRRPGQGGRLSYESALAAARQGRLYPAVILDGGSAEAGRSAPLELARALLCEAPAEARPPGVCRHCRRIVWPGGDEATLFHPDFQVLERDLKASTSVDATREMLRTAQVSPYEARGQVFVVASAESLTGEAANALLKNLEEPHVSAPRNFFLLAPSRLDLLPTLRSRSLAVFLGPAEPVDPEVVELLARAFSAAAAAWASSGSPVYLLSAAAALAGAGGWDDPRSGRPWAVAAAAVLRSLPREDGTAADRRARLALAEALLEGPTLRLRGITAERILEGMVARHLTA